jgi:hypothetical protein
VEDVEVCIILVAGLDESFNVFQDGSKVKLLLFLFLTLEGSFCGINVFFSDNTFLLSLMTIPSTNIFDCLYWSKLIVVDIDVMGDSDEWFVDIGNGVESLSFLLGSLVRLPDLVI